jgi:pSer/pThr/pTyr-binding forkhead associated (FHA) protein
MHFWKIYPEKKEIEVVNFIPGSYIVGRHSKSLLVFTDPSISRHHATVDVSSDGSSIYVTDTSTRGTYHNGTKLAKNAKTQLQDGDTLRFGDAKEIVYKVERGGL